MAKLNPEYRIGIIGCGKMGSELFDFLSGFPFELTMICETEEQIAKLENSFSKKQQRALKYGVIDNDFFVFRQRNTMISVEYNKLDKADLVIETVTEDLDIKRKLFKELSSIVLPGCIVASNSSSIPPQNIFAGLNNEKNCLGLHFFSPVSIKSIVELNLCDNTSEDAIGYITRFLERIDKKYIKLTGNELFLINRIFLKLQAGCCHALLSEDIGTYEIDELIKSNLFPIGVFEFFEHVGLEVMLHSVKNYLNFEYDKTFYQPLVAYLNDRIYEGGLDLRVKKGGYNSANTTYDRVEMVDKMYKWYLDGVFAALESGACSKEDLEFIVRDYMMTEKSPFELAKEIGYTYK